MTMQRRDNQGGRLLMRTPARPRLPDGDCVFISDARIVAGANARGHRCRHDVAGIRFSTYPCALTYKQVTTPAPNRRSRGSSRRRCPSGTRPRRSSSPARGTSPIPGRAFSCRTLRGGCSASRGSERHAGISCDRARGAVRARTGIAVSVWAASRIRWVFC